MISVHWRKILAPIFLCLILFVTACAPNPPSRYAQVQKETTQRGAAPAVAKTAEQGAKFNQFFPTKVRGFEIIPTQEKKGFAEYKVNQGDKTVAMLSISDTASLPTAAAKYQQSSSKIAGYPSVEQGTTATGILVNDRYQVKVLSRDPSFTQADRAAWIQKFDLRGLAKLKGAETAKLQPAAAQPVARKGYPDRAAAPQPAAANVQPEAAATTQPDTKPKYSFFTRKPAPATQPAT